MTIIVDDITAFGWTRRRKRRFEARERRGRGEAFRFVLTQGLLAAALLLGLFIQACAAGDAPLLAYGARIAGDDARTRVVIHFDRKPEFFIHYVADPVRVIVDLPRTDFGFPPQDIQARGLFSDIRYGAMGAASARIVMTATRPVAITVAEVRTDEGGSGFRLVLDAEFVSAPEFAARLEDQKWTGSITVPKSDRVGGAVETDPGTFVIAVDAGHGGIDAGASGLDTAIEEKTITLAFATELAAALNSEPGIKAVLTRDKDEFLSLGQRVQIARRNKANLFISLHADTLKQHDIRGATVYTLSDKASDHLAASLAERENLSDQIGGLALQSGPSEVADILIDLTRRETQAFSGNLARAVVSSFKGQVTLINNPHRHAGFQVLQAPDVPSILLELGFMSNQDDEKLLIDPAWRRTVSALLTKAIRTYRSGAMADGG